MEIKNLKKAAKRILKAIKTKEKIILYGDADLDGVCSVIILKETIKNLGGPIGGCPTSAIYFPNREKEGYGINKEALNFLKKEEPALLIALDCGIGNFEELNLAKKIGFEVIIIDHHETLDKLPKASIIVDPKQKNDKYPFKGLATAGIIFKLSEILLQNKLTKMLRENFLELVALATLADLMPRADENLFFIEAGLKTLKVSFRPGIRAFSQIDSLKNFKTSFEYSQKIISSLNAAGQKNHLSEAYLLLVESDEEKAKILAQNLLEKSYQKHLRINEITSEVEERILKTIKEEIIFEGDSNWPLSFLGPVASRICQRHQKPTFLFKIDKEKSQGAVRVSKGVNSVKLMQRCSHLLETYGGHPPASGFRIKNENLEKFKKCLIKNLEK